MYGLGIRERREGVREREREAESGYNARCSRCFCTDEKGTAKERERERGDIYIWARKNFFPDFLMCGRLVLSKKSQCVRVFCGYIYLSFSFFDHRPVPLICVRCMCILFVCIYREVDLSVYQLHGTFVLYIFALEMQRGRATIYAFLKVRQIELMRDIFLKVNFCFCVKTL